MTVNQDRSIEHTLHLRYNVFEAINLRNLTVQKNIILRSFLLGIFILLLSTPNMLLSEAHPQKDSDLNKEYRSAEKYLQNGLKSLQKGNLEKAKKQFLECLEKFPQYAQAHFFLSQIFYQKGDLENALVQIEKAEHDSDAMTRVLMNAQKESESQRRAQRMEMGRQLENLEAAWETQDARCAFTAAILSTRSEINALEGQEAVSVASSTSIPASYFFLHGNILFRLKDYDNARKQYLAAIQIVPKHGEAYNNLANLYYMARQYEEALDCLNQSLISGVKINEELKAAIFNALGTPGADIMERDFPGGVRRFTLNAGDEKTPLYMNVYVVFNKESGDAVLIDPGVKDKRIETFIEARSLKVRAILNTHGHRDHIGANRYYADKYSVDIYSHTEDRELYADENQVQSPTKFFVSEDSLSFQNLTVKVIHTPGHSQGSCCFLINGVLFSGDCLFKGGIGRVWGESTLEQVQKTNQEIESIRTKLCILPPETPVMPGHGLSTTIENESKNNPYLNKALAFEILRRTLQDHEQIENLERCSSDSDPYDVNISLASPQDIESFQKTYGTCVLGLRLHLTASQQ